MDIYFDNNYGKLYEDIEQGEAVVYHFKCDYGEIKYQFIKRIIPGNVTENKRLYDIITPYGYGGPIILSDIDNEHKEHLVTAFDADFQNYCNDHNVISEFIRFHPVIENALDFNKIYNAKYMRNTTGTRLNTSDDPVQYEFSKSCRSTLKKAIKSGITYKIKDSPGDLTCFREIYYQTMERNAANSYYYFDKKYFQDCLRYFGEKIVVIEAIYQDSVIASTIYLKGDNTLHMHLSGTVGEYLKLSPAYVLQYGIALWGKENGYELIHHGGGRSNMEDDPLYKFKKKFGQHTSFDFYIGQKIRDKECYNRLCELSGVRDDNPFFPAYRENIAIKPKSVNVNTRISAY